MRSPLSLDEALRELSLAPLQETSTPELLTRVAELAQHTIDGVVDASMTLIRGEAPETAAHTSSRALRLDESQYALGTGPCLDAALAGDTVWITDIASEQRYPAFVESATEAGIATTFSVGLPIQEDVVGALNLYGESAEVFTHDSVMTAERLASYAAVALANTRSYEHSVALAARLRETMQSRARVEQAKGVLIAREGCAPELALERLTLLAAEAGTDLEHYSAQLIASTARR